MIVHVLFAHFHALEVPQGVGEGPPEAQEQLGDPEEEDSRETQPEGKAYQ